MPEYYVLVSIVGSVKAIEKDLCGHLYSTHHIKAHREAKDYADKLNGGWPLEVLLDHYHTVTPSPRSLVRMMKGFSRFGRRRVTDKKKWG